MSFEKIDNLRDLGGMTTTDGKTVRKGLLIRSGSLFEATDSDVRSLKNDYSLKTVIDLRSDFERDEKPDADIAGVENLHIPIFSETVLGISRDKLSIEELGKTMWLDMPFLYRGMINHPMAIEGFSKVLRIIMNHPDNGAVLWHCSAGKDRCGMVSVFVEQMLGIPTEAIIDDYMATNETAVGIADGIEKKFISRGVPVDIAERIRALFVADMSYLEGAFSEMEANYGGIDGFIRDGLKISDEAIEKFRKKCLIVC